MLPISWLASSVSRPHPRYSWDFRRKIPENFWKDARISQSFSWNSPRAHSWEPPQACKSRHLKPSELFQNSLPLNGAGDVCFFRSGSGDGLSELVSAVLIGSQHPSANVKNPLNIRAANPARNDHITWCQKCLFWRLQEVMSCDIRAPQKGSKIGSARQFSKSVENYLTLFDVFCPARKLSKKAKFVLTLSDIFVTRPLSADLFGVCWWYKVLDVFGQILAEKIASRDGWVLLIGACAMTTKFLENKICTFETLLSWRFPRKTAFLDDFPLCPKAPPSKTNANFYFYCRLAVSDFDRERQFSPKFFWPKHFRALA